MARILIVEDDENISKAITATLSMVGYHSDICDNGRDAVPLINSKGYDLILLDVMLPGLDGFEVMERVKSSDPSVIFLTARQNVLDKVNGLRLGAEDYIVKPFEPLELLARIEVVLRRKNKLSDTITYGNITADISRHSVTKGGERISLTPKEFDLFIYFLNNIDIAIPRDRLLSAVWGFEFEGESRTVDIHIQQLRKKLSLHEHLITIPKLGYRLDRFEVDKT